jgi:hypothetical protein
MRIELKSEDAVPSQIDSRFQAVMSLTYYYNLGSRYTLS